MSDKTCDSTQTKGNYMKHTVSPKGFKLSDFYQTISSQLIVLFIANLVFCILAASIIVFGVMMVIQGNTEIGLIMTVSSVLSEAIALLFSNQYIRIFKLTNDSYSKVIVYESMNQVIDYILELPLTDNNGMELRYLEFRECVRPVMKGYGEMLNNQKSL